ncbi:hypothetical protein [Streptomyces sp. NPDC059894]|uniref:hypothetical protein n=1 Tax=unclassified Streptomyces TaxID=2593676 RepID=UPI00365042C8
MSDDASRPHVPEGTGGEGTDRDGGRDPWAAPGSVPEGEEGPQYAGPVDAGPQDARTEVSLDKGEDRTPPPPVHDQLTVTSLPAEPQPSGPPPTPATVPRTAAPAPQNPFASPQDGAAVPAPPSPFASPRDGAAVPQTSVPASPSPFASPRDGAAVPAPQNPFAVPQDGAVPPPPIAPDGPGQVPYGYPGDLGHPGPAAYGGAPGGYFAAPAGYGGTPGYGGAPTGYGVPGGHGGAPGYYGWSAMRPMENGTGVAAMVLGIVAVGGFCMWPAAIVMGILAVVFGAIGRGKANRGQASNGGQALAGIICGAAGVVLGIGMLVLVLVAP